MKFGSWKNKRLRRGKNMIGNFFNAEPYGSSPLVDNITINAGTIVNASTEIVSDNIDDIRKNTSKIEELSEKVETLDTVFRAYWNLLKRKGYTDDDFNKCIEKVYLEKQEKKDTEMAITCAKCGKRMTRTGAFVNNCIYCGYSTVSSPYLPDKIDATNENVEASSTESNKINEDDSGNMGQEIEENINVEEQIDVNAVASNDANYSFEEDLKFEDM
jgi:hypothetical protein